MSRDARRSVLLVPDDRVTEEATVGRNVVIHERTGDPAGYSISYDEQRWFRVVRVVDAVCIGRFETRVAAIAAAEADWTRAS